MNKANNRDNQTTQPDALYNARRLAQVINETYSLE